MPTHIQIGATDPRIQYAGNDVQTQFTYPFPIFATSDLLVYLDTTLLTEGDDYTVAGAGDSAGGSITCTTAPATGETVTLLRQSIIERTSDFQEAGEFRAKVLNDDLDRIVAALQEVSIEASRGLKLSPTDTTETLELPIKADRIDKVLTFDTNGDPSVLATDGFAGPTGPQGPAGNDGTDGANGTDGVFAGTEATVTPTVSDKVAILDADDSDSPKFATIQTILDLGGSDTTARDLAMTAYIKADLAASDPAGTFGPVSGDNFTSDSLATKTGATYDATGHYYVSTHNYGSPALVSGGTGTIIDDGNSNTSNPDTVVGKAFDGTTNTAHNYSSGTSSDTTTRWVGKQWSSAKLITQAKFYGPNNYGAHYNNAFNIYFEGSNDGSSWTTLDSLTSVGSGSSYVGTLTYSGSNAYLRHRLRLTSGATAWYSIAEIEFYEMPDLGLSDITLVPNAVTLATANPLDMSAYFRIEEVDAITLGTDLNLRMSIDGGTTWANATEVEVGQYGTSDVLIRADADVSGQTGNSLVWELTTANNKEVRVKQVAVVPLY
ncbi:MAG: hypothetical protein ACPGNT_00905 [Rhodospirillales bacterium]